MQPRFGGENDLEFVQGPFPAVGGLGYEVLGILCVVLFPVVCM